MRQHRLRRAFTLIELLIVIIVVSVLAAIAIPKAANSARRSKEATLRQTLSQLRNAQMMFFQFYEAYPNDLEDLTDINPPSKVWTNDENSEPFGSRQYQGPLLQQGTLQSNHYINDPVSGGRFSVSRRSNGELRIRSSATGRDSNGVLYSSY